MKNNAKTPRLGLPPLAAVILIILPLVFAFAALLIGRFAVSPADFSGAVMRFFTGGAAERADAVIGMRLRRIILAALCGAGLAVSGSAYQGLFQNPLATPDTLGVASGASFGAALAILLGGGILPIQLSALLFGGAAVVLTKLTSPSRGNGTSAAVLAGIMIQSLFNALISLIKFAADTDDKLPSITYWLMGSLQSASWAGMALGAPLIIIGITVLFLLRWRLNLLSLSDDEARSSGVDMKKLRLAAVVCATAITASCVSMCGQVGWVGLLVPHMMRLIFGSNQRRLIPASIFAGAAFMIAVDTAARSLTAAEIPVSILTAIIGAPFFIYLMRRENGNGGVK